MSKLSKSTGRVEILDKYVGAIRLLGLSTFWDVLGDALPRLNKYMALLTSKIAMIEDVVAAKVAKRKELKSHKAMGVLDDEVGYLRELQGRCDVALSTHNQIKGQLQMS